MNILYIYSSFISFEAILKSLSLIKTNIERMKNYGKRIKSIVTSSKRLCNLRAT
ncbi:MAG: hypothetical protein K0R21_1620 [Anaerocolumna sp.]|jgi:hypothetical protein|nr:hypothetical protein [Anaerocolumna sp.]